MYKKLFLSVAVAGGLLLVWLGSPPRYRGPVSDHFDGQSFVNRQPHEKTLLDLWKMVRGGPRATWPEALPVTPSTPPPAAAPGVVQYTYIGHASFLIQVNQTNILTDPVFSQYASPVSFAGPKRVRQPGIRLQDLPDIDVILISHDHYDHLDVESLQQLQMHNRRGKPPLILVGLGVGQVLHRAGIYRYRELDWYDRVTLGEISVWFVPCKHRSGRWLWGHKQTLWGAYALDVQGGTRLYFGGDTGYDTHFAEVGDLWGPFALALLPIGAYEPRWFMRDVHVNPAESVQAHLDLRSQFSVGMHYGTFQLTYEGVEEPEVELRRQLQRAGVAEQDFVPGEFGVLRSVPLRAAAESLPQLEQMGHDRPELWRASTPMIDADHPQIRRLAQDITTGLTTERARAVAVHNWVRDRIAFGWVPHADQERASDTLQRKMGFGVTKSTLFVALLRSLGLAARSRFVSLDGAIFAQFGWHQALVDHAYTEVFLDGHWVATDSYVLPQHQARVALEKLQTLGLQMGYGVSQGGHWSWEGSHAQFIQWTDSVVRQQEFSFFRDFAEFSHYERPSHMGNWWVWLWQPHAAMRLHEQVVKTLGES